MSKVADLEQEYRDHVNQMLDSMRNSDRCEPFDVPSFEEWNEYNEYLKDVSYNGDEGPLPDDVEAVPMTLDQYRQAREHEKKAAELNSQGKCEACERRFEEVGDGVNCGGVCTECMDTYCWKMSGCQS